VTSDSKARMVRGAALLYAAQGANGTSFADVIEASGAPRGSIYHHFPRGKAQLSEDAVRWTSEQVVAHLDASPGGPPAAVLEHFVTFWRGSAGCPVTGVAVDSTRGAEIMDAVGEAFGSWARLLAERLERSGLDAERATTVAWTALACMEGALILGRAEGSAGPFDAVAAELARLV